MFLDMLNALHAFVPQSIHFITSELKLWECLLSFYILLFTLIANLLLLEMLIDAALYLSWTDQEIRFGVFLGGERNHGQR